MENLEQGHNIIPLTVKRLELKITIENGYYLDWMQKLQSKIDSEVISYPFKRKMTALK